MFGYIQKSLGDIRIEVRPKTLFNNANRFFVRESPLVHTFTYQRIVDIGNGHQPPRKGNRVSDKALRVSGTIPFFMMAPRDIFSQ